MNFTGNYRYGDLGIEATPLDLMKKGLPNYPSDYKGLNKLAAELLLGIGTPFYSQRLHHFLQQHLPYVLPQEQKGLWTATPPDPDHFAQTFDYEIHRLRLPQHPWLASRHKECFLNLLTTRYSDRPDQLQYYSPQVEVYFASELDGWNAEQEIKVKCEAIGAIGTPKDKLGLRVMTYADPSEDFGMDRLMTQLAYDPFLSCWKMQLQYGDHDWG